MITRVLVARQHGFVMIVALIMLLAVTLLVASAANVVQANLKVVQNMEVREQARAAALAAIEEAISNGTSAVLPRFIETPDDIFLQTCDGVTLTCVKENNVKKYDTNADGIADITVSLSDPDNLALYPPPRCVLGRKKLNDELNAAEQAQLCESEISPDGVFHEGSNLGKIESSCAESVWEFKAVARDEVTGAEVVVRQGVSVSITENDILTYCG